MYYFGFCSHHRVYLPSWSGLQPWEAFNRSNRPESSVETKIAPQAIYAPNWHGRAVSLVKVPRAKIMACLPASKRCSS